MKDSRINNDKKLTLYHGSKSGFYGAIAPVSRKHCDFGRGFLSEANRLKGIARANEDSIALMSRWL